MPALATAAFGGLPKPDNPTIKPPKSIGGVKLGVMLEQADEAWGSTGECVNDAGFEACSYGNPENKKGYAEIDASKGKVALVALQAGLKQNGRAVFEGPLLDFTTAKGEIGLGSKMSEVKEAYGKAQKLPKGIGYGIPGKDKTELDFIGFGTKKKRYVSSILLFDSKNQG